MNNSKPIYVDCMEEASCRLQHAWTLLKRLDADAGIPKKHFAIESVALHYRKVTELIAIASISANQEHYKAVRSKFRSDWHAVRIFRDIRKINPLFYPIPIKVDYSNPNGPGIIDEVTGGHLTEDEAAAMYDYCGGLLHAENRYRAPRNLDDDITYFTAAEERFKQLLSQFWVYLVPDRFRLLVQVDLTGHAGVRWYPLEVEDNARQAT
jgi:hypothetical protein